MKKYVCDVCGWVNGDSEHGIKPGTSFENLPEDWTCPECGVGKDRFSPIKLVLTFCMHTRLRKNNRKLLQRTGLGIALFLVLSLQVNFTVFAESSENKGVEFDVKLKNPANIADLKNLEQYLEVNPYDIDKIDQVTNLIIAAVDVLNRHYSKYPGLKEDVFQRKLKFKFCQKKIGVTEEWKNSYYMFGYTNGETTDKNGDMYQEEDKAWGTFYFANWGWLVWLDVFDRVTWHYVRNEFAKGFYDGWKQSGGKSDIVF